MVEDGKAPLPNGTYGVSQDCIGNDGYGKFSINIDKYVTKGIKYRYIAIQFGFDSSSIIESDMKFENKGKKILCEISMYKESILLSCDILYDKNQNTLEKSLYMTNQHIQNDTQGIDYYSYYHAKVITNMSISYNGKEYYSSSRIIPWNDIDSAYSDSAYGYIERREEGKRGLFTRDVIVYFKKAFSTAVVSDYSDIKHIEAKIYEVSTGLFFYFKNYPYVAFHNEKKLYEGEKEVSFVGEYSGNIYFTTEEDSVNTTLYKNENKIYTGIQDVKICNNDIYYMKGHEAIYKNDTLMFSCMPNAYSLGTFTVSNMGDIAYSQINNGGTTSVYLNGNLSFRTTRDEIPICLTLSPNGKHLYYYIADASYWANPPIRVCGFDVPPNVAGWYARYIDFIFSPDSNHVACAVEARDGYIIFCDSQVIVRRYLSQDMYFSSDSKYLIFHSKTSSNKEMKEEQVELK